jgi:hypothetical protein
MKSLVFIVLIVLAGIAGYNFINKPTEAVPPTAVVEEATPVTEPAQNEAASSEVESSADVESTPNVENNTEESAAVETDTSNTTTPADMPEEAQHEMYKAMMDYNKCMMQDKPEYHDDKTSLEAVAGKTLAECEPNLDTLKSVLEKNNVNAGLTEGMAKTVRQRTVRKLMSAVMQAQATTLMSHEAETPAETK